MRMHTHNWARTAGQTRGRCMQTKQLVMQVSHKWVALEGLDSRDKCAAAMAKRTSPASGIV